jgi:hypothetical protein
MLPARGPPLFDATAYMTVRVPIPPAEGLTAEIQESLKVSAQEHVGGVVMVNEPKPPAEGNDGPSWESEYVQVAPAGRFEPVIR